MAKKNRPAHGGVSFHRCEHGFVLALHDSNHEAYAHANLDTPAVGGLAGELMRALIDDAKAAGVPVNESHQANASADRVRNVSLGDVDTVGVAHHHHTGIYVAGRPVYARGQWELDEFIEALGRELERKPPGTCGHG